MLDRVERNKPALRLTFECGHLDVVPNSHVPQNIGNHIICRICDKGLDEYDSTSVRMIVNKEVLSLTWANVLGH